MVHVYGPLVYTWCLRAGLQEADAADVGQDVFRTVAESIEKYRHDREGDSFRGWLRTITRTRVVDFLRQKASGGIALGGADSDDFLASLADTDEESAELVEDDRLAALKRAAELVLGKCKDATREAFLRVVIAGDHPADVAADLGISINAVYVAKSHILARLRQEFDELIDSRPAKPSGRHMSP